MRWDAQPQGATLVADIRLTSLTQAAPTFSNLAVSRTPRPRRVRHGCAAP